MLEFAGLPLDQRVPYFQEVANRRGLTRLIVEKDFWVCFSLRLLFSTPALADKFVFKGGTSLSKVFGIIKRFSEDIDLSVDPDWLGFGGENRPDTAKSRSQFEKRWKKLNDACAATVDQTVRPVLEQAIQDALGPTQDGASYLAFRLDEQTHSPVLTFRYPTTEPDRPGYLHPQVKLELGSLTDQRPIGDHTVTPWVAEEFPSLFAAPACHVVALEIERTFWEKATILHTEHHRPADKPMRSRLSRDCYDVCRMAADPAGRRAMEDLDLLARVVRHKRAYFQSAWANYDAAKPGSLRLVPPNSRLADLKADYQQMQEMFTEPPPSFDEILRQLRNIEDTLNKG
ncbi:MAG: nucleotidyl transferase AbiEii/AbiGii toxin family protein [Candidatus Krumholzibacteriia bacterium]